MSIWVTGSLEVRDSSDRLVLQVGDSSGDSPTKSMSTEVTGSFEVVSNVDTTNYKILTASHNGVAPAVGIGVTSAPNVNFAIGGDLGLTDTASDSRLTVQANTNAYLNVGVDNNNRGFMFWEGGDQRIRFGTKEGGSNYFSSFIIKSGSADILSDFTVGNDLTVTNNTVTTGLKVRGDSITASDDGTPIQWDTSDNVTIGGTIQVNGNAIKASDGDTPIQWDTNDNVTIAGQITVEGGSVNVDGTSTSTSPSTIKLRTYDTDGIASSDQVGVVEFYGSEDGINNYPMAYILAAADETFVPATNFGSKLVFGTATNGGTLGPKMTLDNAGDLEITGEVQINGNAILASDGGTPISWDTSDNVTIGGAIKVSGNAIQASDDGIPIQWDTSDNVTIGGDVEIRGNDIKGSAGSVSISLNGPDVTVAGHLRVEGNTIEDDVGNVVITLDSGNATVEGELIANGDIIKDSGDNSIFEFDGSGHISNTVTLQGTDSTRLILRSDNDSSVVNPGLTFRKYDSGGITNGGALGTISFQGLNTNGSTVYSGATIRAEAVNAGSGWTSSTSSAARLEFQTKKDGDMLLSTRLLIADDGCVKIGTEHSETYTTNSEYLMEVQGNGGTGINYYIARIANTNTGASADVIRSEIGATGNAAATHYFLGCHNTGGTRYGKIAGDGSGGIQITNAFTGYHPTVISKSDNIELGMITDSTGTMWAKSGISTGIPKVTVSTTEASKKVYGIVSEIFTGENEAHGYEGYVTSWGLDSSEDHIKVNSVGEGSVLVTNINGEVSNGDYIVTSNIPGLGQRQNDDILRASTVAKCVEDVDWNSVTETVDHNGITYKRALVCCTYTCG